MPLKIGLVNHSTDARCEIVRSFSYKLNMGGGTFESRDFFCSQKSECRIEDAEDISTRLYQFCKNQVLNAVADYLRTNPSRIDQRKAS